MNEELLERLWRIGLREWCGGIERGCSWWRIRSLGGGNRVRGVE